MKYLKRFLLLAFIILLGVFAFRNQTFLGQPVNLVFIRQPVSLVLGFWLVACFLAGVLVYMIIDMPRDLVLKKELRRKNQEVARLQAELNRLHAAAAGAQPPPPQSPPPNQDLEKRLGL